MPADTEVDAGPWPRAYYTPVVGGLSMVAGSAALAALLAVESGAAQSEPPSSPPSPLRIDCPGLDQETRAAFEARARAEMALSPLPRGEIAIACELHAAHIGWHAASGGIAQRDVSLDAGADATVDSLLGAVHALRSGAANPPAPLAVAISGTVSTVAATPAPLAIAAKPAPEAPHALPFRLGVEAGIYGEVWEGSVAGGVEGQFGLRLDTRTRWEVAVTGGLGRGVEAASGIRASMSHVAVGLAHLPVPNLEIEAGGLIRWLDVHRSRGVGTDDVRASALGGFAALRYVLARGRFALAVGPHLSLLQGSLIVDDAGTEVFRVPRFVTGVALAGRADFIR